MKQNNGTYFARLLYRSSSQFVRVCTEDWLQSGYSLHGSNNTELVVKLLNMTYCSFDNNSDRCGAVKWALRNDAIISLSILLHAGHGTMAQELV